MKKIIGLFIIFLIIFSIVVVLAVKDIKEAIRSFGGQIPVSSTITPPSPAVSISSYPTISIGGKRYAYAVDILSNESHLLLFPNFTKKLSALEIKGNNNCSAVFNANFYDKESKPLGLFVANGEIIGRQIASRTFNGFFYETTGGNFVISSLLPQNYGKIALQSGPLLLENHTPYSLKIQNDVPARRVFVFTNGKTAGFGVVFEENALLSGPLLGELPVAVNEISKKEKLAINDAINLDGGSASAFITRDANLSELTPIGGAFCIQ